LQIKDRLIIKIESIAFGGEGVGRVDNFVVFVPFAAPGDELEIEITQQKKKFVRGKILKIIKPSAARAKPLCRYYESCGGCCYQHLKYEHQLEIKKKTVIGRFLENRQNDIYTCSGANSRPKGLSLSGEGSISCRSRVQGLEDRFFRCFRRQACGHRTL
jgi:tRNA/tmRNA/rRNA uracil-C5-methylase (TrmA/RlmC/RlmD family)